MASKNKLTSDFKRRHNQLKTSFPTAHHFLSELIQEAKRPGVLSLSTAQNAHVYLNNGYLMYIILDPDEGSIVLRKRRNNHIRQGAGDISDRIWPSGITALVEHHQGVRNQWARALEKEDGFEIHHHPDSAGFFKELLSQIHGIPH